MIFGLQRSTYNEHRFSTIQVHTTYICLELTTYIQSLFPNDTNFTKLLYGDTNNIQITSTFVSNNKVIICFLLVYDNPYV